MSRKLDQVLAGYDRLLEFGEPAALARLGPNELFFLLVVPDAPADRIDAEADDGCYDQRQHQCLGKAVLVTCSFTQELADLICDRLAEGATLRAICRGSGLPSERTVRRWVLDEREGFASRYLRARDLGLDAMADELLEIADDGRNDRMRDDNGREIIDHDHIARSRLRVDSRKWYLSKLAPKRYGERLSHEQASANQEPLLVTTINFGCDKNCE